MSDSRVEIKTPKGRIMETLLLDHQFKDEGAIIRKWESEENSKNFISEISKSNIHFIGVLNSNLEKDGYGFLDLPNGDRYFGVYSSDLRSKHGIYQFPDKLSKDESKVEREFFFGLFDNGVIYDHGVYLWIREKKGVPMFHNFDDADFSCFIGELDEKHFRYGTYLTKDGNNYYVYHGGFNEDNEKQGEGVFFYNSEGDELMYGNVSNNKFSEGYLAVFDDEGVLKDGIFVTYGDDGEIKDFKQKDEVPENKKIFDKMFDFRNTIMGKDYFGEVFESFQKTVNFMNTNVNLNTFESKDKFPKLMQVTYEFNKIKINEDIEKLLESYEKNKI